MERNISTIDEEIIGFGDLYSIDLEELDDIDTISASDFERPAIKVMYVDNIKLSEEMAEWEIKVKEAKSNNKEIPEIPTYTAECILSISDNMGKKYNYREYSWIDEMKSDAVEDCCKYLHNYDTSASTRSSRPNPYGYISRIVSQAFNNRIVKEKRQDYYKNKSLEILGGVEAFDPEDLVDLCGVGKGAEYTVNMINDMIERAHKYEDEYLNKKIADKAKIPAKELTHYNLLDF
jgi:hypothetical protein